MRNALQVRYLRVNCTYIRLYRRSGMSFEIFLAKRDKVWEHMLHILDTLQNNMFKNDDMYYKLRNISDVDLTFQEYNAILIDLYICDLIKPTSGDWWE